MADAVNIAVKVNFFNQNQMPVKYEAYSLSLIRTVLLSICFMFGLFYGYNFQMPMGAIPNDSL
jgi:hypothetical protein